MEHQVKETDYGTFMSMIEKKNIGEVEVNDNQIIFTDKDQKNIYKTGLMNDPNLTDRLYECGAVFAKDIDKQMSPIISFLLTGILPLILFIALGNYMAKKLMEHAGGKNSMAFGMGKEQCEGLCGIYYRNPFSRMLQEKMRRRKTCQRLLIIFIIRRNIRMIGAVCQKVPSCRTSGNR